ncbi:glycosylphosphatidylinositol anchor attachment 1 protein [Ostrinia furnacalis]|uniref:glycosylphosphatidylinositol anchor attachment 1 protein n=1 Tax=Ostrinia furnacalis TaxID=93504 RepID=UPI00103DBE35|nr:glycosylphosphatidylinositol anchor attachment 1 protein [Ostrinia furnacalis]
MGLLSDPEYGSVKWVKVLKRIHRPLCFLCYFAAIAWFFMLGNKEFNNETYFSENALLPGLVTNEFNAEQDAKQYYNELNQELADKYSDTDEIPVPWLVAKMSQLHLEVHTHNFTLEFPLGGKQIFKGVNVYGILRAPRTSSHEAIVVTAPHTSISSHHKGTTAGIALMLAFAKFARPQKYWAKDIIFLVTEHEQLGMQAWLEAYHGLNNNAETFYTSLGSFWRPSVATWAYEKLGNILHWTNNKKCLDPGKLKARSGSIQAAINLEFHTPNIKYIEVKVEGLNGQLPNLDLVNLVHKLCVKSGIHHSYKHSYSWIRNRDKMADWKNSIKTMLSMVFTQIIGVPTGNHGLFHRFGIEAVTLEGRDAGDPAGVPPKVNVLTSANFYRLAVPLESVLRSLNNLLERFHQSYFFYLLAATNRFISIGQYMPCLCLLCVAMLVRALSLWVTIQQDGGDGTQSETQSETEDSEWSTEGSSDSDVPVGQNQELRLRKKNNKLDKKKKDMNLLHESPKKEKPSPKKKRSKLSIVKVGKNFLILHLLGYAVMQSPPLFTFIGRRFFDQFSERSLYYGLFAAAMFLSGYTLTIPFAMTREEMVLTNILALVELATVCLAVGMHNFSLGLAIAVMYTPLALWAKASKIGETKMFTISYVLKIVMTIFLHPYWFVTINMISYSHILFPEEGIFDMVSRGTDAASQAIMFAVTDSLIYGNWLFNVVTTTILPTWFMFWQLTVYNVVQFSD